MLAFFAGGGDLFGDLALVELEWLGRCWFGAPVWVGHVRFRCYCKCSMYMFRTGDG